MKKQTIVQYTILYQYLLLLKEPLYVFLSIVLQHLSPVTWWEEFILPILNGRSKANFKYLDFADLLNVLQYNWKRINKYLDKDDAVFTYNDNYRMVTRVHDIRTVVAHANDADMSQFVLVDCLSDLLEFAQFIGAREIAAKLQDDLAKHRARLPAVKPKKPNTAKQKEEILELINARVILRPALPSLKMVLFDS
jgi:hypothetical protein